MYILEYIQENKIAQSYLYDIDNRGYIALTIFKSKAISFQSLEEAKEQLDKLKDFKIVKL